MYFTVASAAASLFKRGVLLLEAGGSLRVSKTALEFRESLIALNYSRRPAAKLGYKGETYKDIRDNRL